jgi:hypothetical protein
LEKRAWKIRTTTMPVGFPKPRTIEHASTASQGLLRKSGPWAFQAQNPSTSANAWRHHHHVWCPFAVSLSAWQVQ